MVLLQTTHRLKQSEEDYNFTEKNDKCRPAPHFEVGLISAGFSRNVRGGIEGL